MTSNTTRIRSASSVNAEFAACLIGEMMTEESRLDLGHSFVVRGQHPEFGEIIVFNSAEGSSAFIHV